MPKQDPSSEALEKLDIEDIQAIESQLNQFYTIHPFRSLDRRESVFLTYGGFLFLVAALGGLAVLAATIYKMGGVTSASYRAGTGLVSASELIDHYASALSAPLILLFSSSLTAAMGYLLLKAAGASGRQVIPAQDYPLLSKLLSTGNEKGINEYIRLSSLQGITGLFTKIGLTGLPLATIALTLLFALISVFSAGFVDLTKLTLGAFLGSYVQRNVPTQSQGGA